MSVVDLSRARWQRAEKCTDITAVDALREATAQIDNKEINVESVIVIALVTDDDGDQYVEMFHGGPASTNERIGIMARAQYVSTTGGI